MTIKGPSPVASTLRGAMEQANMTQLELAERSGVDRATVGRILRDEVDEVKGSQLARLAIELGLDPFALIFQAIGLDNVPSLTPDQEAQILAAIIKADPGMRDIMGKVSRFGPVERVALLTYIELLQRQGDPQSPLESQ